jgi:hypothetical protein
MAHWTKPNHTFVAEYQQSCLPYVTSSNGNGEALTSAASKISFPGVTRWVEVRNTGAETLRVGFSALGVLGKGAVTGSNPIDGKEIPVLAGFATNQESQADHRNYFLLPEATGDTIYPSTGRWELKCTEMFFAGGSGATDFTVVASITTVPRDHFVVLSGSAGFRGVG